MGVGLDGVRSKGERNIEESGSATSLRPNSGPILRYRSTSVLCPYPLFGIKETAQNNTSFSSPPLLSVLPLLKALNCPGSNFERRQRLRVAMIPLKSRCQLDSMDDRLAATLCHRTSASHPSSPCLAIWSRATARDYGVTPLYGTCDGSHGGSRHSAAACMKHLTFLYSFWLHPPQQRTVKHDSARNVCEIRCLDRMDELTHELSAPRVRKNTARRCRMDVARLSLKHISLLLSIPLEHITQPLYPCSTLDHLPVCHRPLCTSKTTLLFMT